MRIRRIHIKRSSQPNRDKKLIELAQRLAPSYLRVPNDGAKYRCSDCNELFEYDQVIKPFTSDGKNHLVICLNCVDKNWFANAKNANAIATKSDIN